MKPTTRSNPQNEVRQNSTASIVRGVTPSVTALGARNTQEGISLRAYARHRGTSAPSVLRAIRSGRLTESIVRDARGSWRVDTVLADQEWPQALKPPGISLRAYARHRGVSAPSILRAVRAGRLRASLAFDENGCAKIADVVLADQEWAGEHLTPYLTP